MVAKNDVRDRGAKNAYLDAFSFQSTDFYCQHGYQVFDELPNFPPVYQHYFLTKQLQNRYEFREQLL